MTNQENIPTVMAFSGSDPTGGAGIQADIETLASMGCHTVPIITAVTIQDTQNVHAYSAIDASLLIQQARAVLEDIAISMIKIGMLGSVEIIEIIHTLLNDYPDIPVVLDPVLIAGGGTKLANDSIRTAMIALLYPRTMVLTPNTIEARLLAPEADTLEACAQEILDMGCEYLLITGTHENTPKVINTLYSNHRKIDTFEWERLPNSYHGSGCTLSSAIAGLLAQGNEPMSAIHEAQVYTWETLKHGYRIGMGQHIPNRLFWARSDND